MKKTQQISQARRLLQNPYAYLDGNGGYDAIIYRGTTPETDSKPSRIRFESQRGRDKQIERIVKKLHGGIWRNRFKLCPDGVADDPVALLDPSIALISIGFKYISTETLGQYHDGDGAFEVAGLIDQDNKLVQISRQFPRHTRRFTAAHELGHAVLHEHAQMHRDRPVDGSGKNQGRRSKIEKEADKFASLFLMPENLVRKRFRDTFLCDRFALNESTGLALGLDSQELDDFLGGKKSLRELTRIIARTEVFNYQHIKSFANQFDVSVEAMSIRIEELDLIK